MNILIMLYLSIADRSSPAFRTFNTQHVTTLGIIAATSILAACLGRRGSPSRRRWIGRTIGFVLLAYAAGFYVQQAIGRSLAWQYSLPLELCNLVLAACMVSLFWPNRLSTEIAYFWGLGGVLQATLTPDITQGFPSWEYFLFFLSHGASLVAIVFLVSDRSFSVRRSSIFRMMIALNIYGLVVGGVDAVMKWNYGYLCRKPGMPSLLDFLGPWPWYLVSIELIALLTFLILYLPWCFLTPGKQSKTVTVDL